MQEFGTQQVFEPERQRGLIFHIGLTLVLLAIAVSSLLAALEWAQGSLVVVLLITSLLTIALLPLVVYRAYALLNASYVLERDGFRIRWGLRSEDIPLTAVEWVRPIMETGFHVPLPVFKWSGAILGVRSTSDWGEIEFIASDVSKMLLVATHQKIYAISPQNPREFATAFRRALEMGSLSPITPRSAKPAAFIQSVWQKPLARWLLSLNVGLTIILWLVGGFIIANHSQLPLGFSAQGLPLEQVASERLLLLPVIGALVLVMNLVLGFFFYRRPEQQLVSFLLWIAGAVTPVLLLLSMVLLSFA